jgi:hypothetical protein
MARCSSLSMDVSHEKKVPDDTSHTPHTSLIFREEIITPCDEYNSKTVSQDAQIDIE